METQDAAAAQAQAAVDELLSFEFVCKLHEIPDGGRRCVLLPSSKRSVMLLHLNGQLYCMDQACYRTYTYTCILSSLSAAIDSCSYGSQTTAVRS